MSRIRSGPLLPLKTTAVEPPILPIRKTVRSCISWETPELAGPRLIPCHHGGKRGWGRISPLCLQPKCQTYLAPLKVLPRAPAPPRALSLRRRYRVEAGWARLRFKLRGLRLRVRTSVSGVLRRLEQWAPSKNLGYTLRKSVSGLPRAVGLAS